MNLRNKIGLFLILISLVAVFATGLLILQNAIIDKKNYVTELNSVLGPQISNSIDQKIKNLLVNLNELNLELNSRKLKPEAVLLALNKFKNRAEGVDAVFIKTNQNKLVSFSLNHEMQRPEELNKMSESLANLENAQLPKNKLSYFRDKTYLTPFTDSSFGAVILGETFFKDSFELARGKPSLLVTDKKTVLHNSGLKSEYELIKKVPEDVWSRSELISLELKDSQNQNHLINFSRNGYLKDSFVVLLAPQASWQDLTSPILRSSFGLILFLIIFSVLIAYSISKSLAQPIETLTELTSQIGRGEWRKIEIKGSGIEIRRLTVAFNRMITNLKSREHELKIAQNKIIHSNSLAAVGRMGAGIAHEVKNPLSSILGYGQLIEMKISAHKNAEEIPQLLEKIRDYVKLLLDDTRRANKIISDLLTFARQKEVQTSKTDVLKLAQSFQPKLKATCDAHEISFITDLPAKTEKFVSVDSDQIYQVIYNLVQNSVHALTSDATPSKAITFSTKFSENFAEITISDNGPGIAEENIKKIFEPFYSTKKVGEGTGLGLALCYGIIEQHQGSIEVSSVPGVQTSFRIKLPLVD